MKYQGLLAIMYKDIGWLENLSLWQKLNSFAELSKWNRMGGMDLHGYPQGMFMYIENMVKMVKLSLLP